MIFGNFEIIKERTKNLLSQLRTQNLPQNDNQKVASKWVASTEVGSLFLKEVFPTLQNYYTPYIESFPKILMALSKLEKKYPEFKQFLVVSIKIIFPFHLFLYREKENKR